MSAPLSLLISLLAGVAAVAEPAAPRFARKPSATKAGDAVRIEFAVTQPTDVAVFIEDGGAGAGPARIVRHLVAGVLGKNPPAPLRPNSLSQSIVWDGKTDAGTPAEGGRFRVRVAIGMAPGFDGFLLHNPAATGPISALAVGPTGEVFLFHRDPTANGNMGGNKIKVIGRGGRYLRTTMPFPADIAPERVKPLGVFQTADGSLVPRVHNYEQLSFYPDPLGSRGRSMPLYSSPVVDKRGRLYWLVLGPRLACLDEEGGIPYPTFLGPPLLKDIKGLRMAGRYTFAFDRPCLAVSGDGRWLYLAGLFTGKAPRGGVPVPAVFRINLETRDKAEVFLGNPAKSGREDGLLASPRGLAVANGLLYVADFGNDRIVVVRESDRSLVGEVKIAKPDTLGVDPRTGAIYVCCSTGKVTANLVKLADYGTGKELARLTLPKSGGSPWDLEHRIAVDASASPVVIWMPTLSYSRHQLMRIEDAGDGFTQPVDPRDRTTPWAEGPRDMNVDRRRGELYVKVNTQRWHRLNERTGALMDTLKPGYPALNSGDKGTQLVPGPDGRLYTWSWSKGFYLFDRAGKPVNWPGRESNVIPLGGIMCFQIRHLELLGPDQMLFVSNPAWIKEKHDSRFTSVNVMGPDGKATRTLIWQCMIGAIPRVDAAGNIYLAEMVKPADRSYPEFFDGKLDPPPKESRAAGAAFWTSYLYGSIIKFPPSGGAIWYRPDLPPTVVGKPPADLLAKPKVKVKAHIGYHPHSEAALQGAAWFRFGFGPYSATSSTSTDTCMCEGARFDVDPFGRVFFPNLGQFRVEVVDTNGNPLAMFGRYGNEDASGEKGAPLAWPVAVAVSDTHAYVGDTVSRRVVKVKLTYAAEETCEVK